MEGKILSNINAITRDFSIDTPALYSEFNSKFQQFLDNDVTLKSEIDKKSIKTVFIENINVDTLFNHGLYVCSSCTGLPTNGIADWYRLEVIPAPTDEMFQGKFGCRQVASIFSESIKEYVRIYHPVLDMWTNWTTISDAIMKASQDNGRFQSEFGFKDAIINGGNIVANTVQLGVTPVNKWGNTYLGGATIASYTNFAIVGEKMYGIIYDGTFACFDIVSNVWVETLSKPPSNISGSTLVAIGEKLYVMQSAGTFKMYIYDTLTNTWDTTTGGTTDRIYYNSVAFENKIYSTNSSVSPYKICIYDTLTHKWDTTTGSTYSNFGGKGVRVGDAIYYDGSHSAGTNKMFIRYVPSTNTFSVPSNSTIEKSFVGVIGDIIYCQNNTAPYKIFTYNATTGTAYEAGITNLGLQIVGSVTVGGKLYCYESVSKKIRTYTQYEEVLNGTVVKSYSPNFVQKWGNVRWSQETPANTSVVCDVVEKKDTKINLIPTMSSHTCDICTVSASSENSPYYAYMAVDSNLTTGWSSVGVKAWLKFVLKSPESVSSYSMVRAGAPTPKSWTFEGSKTGDFAGEQVILHTVTSDMEQSAGTGLAKVYEFSNSTAYLAYRINITENIGDSSTIIRHFELFKSPKVLKSSTESFIDLSDINSKQYPSIKLIWTLKRNNIIDASPSISNPSITWEGGREVIDVIQPTKPMASTLISNATSQSYVTVIAISEGKGLVNRMSLRNSASVAGDQIRLTVDGNAVIFPVYYTDTSNMRGIANRTPSSGSTNATPSYTCFDYFAPIYFKSSFKIEYYNAHISASTVTSAIDYVLV